MTVLDAPPEEPAARPIDEAAPSAAPAAPSSTATTGAADRRSLRRLSARVAGGIENGLLAAMLLAMMLLSAAEIVMRQVFDSGIAGSATVVQHGTLVVCMIGAVVAARERRHISLGSAEIFRGKLGKATRGLSSSVAAATSAILAIASWQFVAVEREGDAVLAWGIPLWLVEGILPVGFALVALRFVLSVSDRWPARLSTLTVGAGIVALFVSGRLEPGPAAVGAATVLIATAAVAGAPLFAILGGATLLLHWKDAIPIAAMSVSHYSLVVNPSLPAIPLFTLAGYLLANESASRRLIRLFDALLGGLRGGPALITAGACAFFTTFTGGSGVTILALGGLLLPILLNTRYSERNALGLLTGSAALGILFPPCLPLILYGVAANVEIRSLFIAGVLPGTLMVVLTAWLGWYQQGPAPERRPFDPRAALRAAGEAKWELLLPVVVLTGLFGGFATPVEAAALTALYALVVEVFVYRDYPGLSALTATFVESGLLVGGILLILGVALGLTSYLIDAEIPQLAVQWVTSSVHSPALFLLLLNLFLLIVGMMMDIYSAIVVVVPLITPLGTAFGIDPIHLGIIFLTNLQLGYLTPPIGQNLFVSALRFNRPVSEVSRACLPMILIFSIGTIAVTYWPWLTLAFVKSP